MAFKNAQQSRVLGGILNLSGYLRNFDVATQTDMLDVTTLADTAKVMIPGQNSSTLQLSLLLDTDGSSNGLWERASQNWKASATPVPFTVAPSGTAALSEVFMVEAWEASLSASSAVAGVVEASINAQTTGWTDAGVALSDLEAVTTTANGTARDLTAASSAGGVAHLHVSAFSGITSDVVTIEHSVDGVSSWATLVTFATVTGLTSERVVVPSGTTIRRYLRVVDTVTGTGSCTRHVSFARR